ncbi:MAG: SgcJ/EcaC family oxidoreductase [Actinobacteria bacterium]|nr:SgcJ/EcaC family oxidoreductase [Actinomycetota bacterium]
MAARTAQQAFAQFAKRFNAGDVEGLVALYEPKAALVVEPGKVVTGTAAIRRAMRACLASKPRLSVRSATYLRGGDTALSIIAWTIQTTGPDGKVTEAAGKSADVWRRQPDGSWLLTIDNAFGTA